MAEEQQQQQQAPATDWTTGLAPELKAVVDTKGYKSPADLVNAYVNAERTIGNNLAPPKDGVWSPESLKKLGVPEKPDGYQFEKPQLAEGVVWDEGFAQAALPVAHKLGLTPHQVQGLMAFYAEHQGSVQGAATAQRKSDAEASVTALKQEYGKDYDAKIAMAQRAAKHFGGDAFVKFLNDSGTGNNPEFIRTFAKLGSLIGEDVIRSGVPVGGMTKEMAQAEIAKLQKDPAYTNGKDPEHGAKVARMTQLFQILHPPETQAA